MLIGSKHNIEARKKMHIAKLARKEKLINNGFKVLRLWEFEINAMSIQGFQDKLNEVTR